MLVLEIKDKRWHHRAPSLGGEPDRCTAKVGMLVSAVRQRKRGYHEGSQAKLESGETSRRRCPEAKLWMMNRQRA